MGKSEVVGLVAELAPSSVQACEPDVCANAFGVVVDDTLISLRKWGHTVVGRYGKHTTLTLDALFLDVFACVRKTFETPRESGRDTKMYVCLFDKASMVTVAKQPEQAKRDAANGGAGQHHLSRSANLEWPAHAWQNNINDRICRQEIIRLLCQHAEQVLPTWLQSCPDHIVVLDYEEANGEPCVKIVAGPAVADFDLAAASQSLTNRLGEFDVSSLHYVHSSLVRHMATGTRGVLIRSIDSDMLPIMMLNTLPCRCEGVDVEIQLSIKGVAHLISPRSVSTWVHALLQRPTIEESVQDFVALYILSGSDFAPGVPGVSNRAFVLGFLTQPERGTPGEYLHSVVSSEFVLPERLAHGANAGVTPDLGVRVPGVKRASKNVLDKRANVHTEAHVKRAQWCLSYWSHSVYQPTKMLVTPLGHGFDIVGGKIVLAEDNVDASSKHATKRIKMI